jgi:hypothetical protein
VFKIREPLIRLQLETGEFLLCERKSVKIAEIDDGFRSQPAIFADLPGDFGLDLGIVLDGKPEIPDCFYGHDDFPSGTDFQLGRQRYGHLLAGG